MDTLNAPSPNIMNKLQRCVLGLYSYDEHAEDLTLENIPVSYTHLDVYKRQVEGSGIEYVQRHLGVIQQGDQLLLGEGIHLSLIHIYLHRMRAADMGSSS